MLFHIYDFPYMKISPLSLYKCLADETRLQVLLLIDKEQELCVCELTEALQLSQPKISRHLGQLRACGVLVDRRQGQWVYYRINSALPSWALDILSITAIHNQDYVAAAAKRLAGMGSRPERQRLCC